ncbi:hypothetical protein Leryth_021878 [Lithospermum erythrorhizon]|nr:hypothetical protein Leryth_021878 [Lithospermum erythrorhizon]
MNDLYGDGLDIPPMDTTFLNDDVLLDDHDFDFSIDELLDDSFVLDFDHTQKSTHPQFISSTNNDNPSWFFNNSPNLSSHDLCSLLNDQKILDGFHPTKKSTHPDFDQTQKATNPETSNHFWVLDNSGDSSSFLNNGEILVDFDQTQKSTDHEFDQSQLSMDSKLVNSEERPARSNFSGVLDHSLENFGSSGDGLAGFVSVPSPESIGLEKGADSLVREESEGSGNCGSNVSEACSNKLVTSSPNSDNNSLRNGFVDRSIDLDGYVKNEGVCVDDVKGISKKNGLLKRKKDNSINSNGDANSNKVRKSVTNGVGDNIDIVSGKEGKKMARLLRNRESAQLSRQRKKHYVEELEDKVRTMNAAIQDLNAKISYIVAENASLKQQIGGGVVPPMMAPPPGMYPPMMYPWMPAPPYMMKTQRSQVPLVPIPRLKSQKLSSAPKNSKKTENKKSEGRTKKVASVSFLGLLFFMLLFGGLVPMVNIRYGGVKNQFMGRSEIVGNGHYEKLHGRVLSVKGSGYSEKVSKTPDMNSKFNCAPRDHCGGEPSAKHGGCEIGGERNGSEPLMASLYVPRNDKLVKIDGNLIIHSILASEKATTPCEGQQEKTNDETGLAIPGDLVPSNPRRNAGKHPHLTLGSGGESENFKSKAADRHLHQWFLEGLAGPMLSSGRCTEVFQFDVVSASSPGGMISATSARNLSTAGSKNSTHISKGRNRRILPDLPIPLPGSSAHNISEEGIGRDAGNGNFSGTNSSSSRVVSVLLDPREAADAEVDGVMRVKSLPRIFVVVLIDGVKYVTYSCMFPFKGAAVPHL